VLLQRLHCRKLWEEITLRLAIKGSWHFESKYQYEVMWVGYNETTWIDVDKLACYNLIEEYEIKSA
jgi:hypothetical protein